MHCCIDRSAGPASGDETEAFSLEARVADRCTVLLILTDELLNEFTTEDANPLLWSESVIRRIYAELDQLVQRLSH